MSGTTTLLQLGGYVALLLWGTHMVSTGVERGFGAELRLWLGRSDRDSEEAPAAAAADRPAPLDRSGGPVDDDVEHYGLRSG